MFSIFTSSNVPKPEDSSLFTVTLSAVISLAYNIYVWYNKAMKDKKLSVKEAKELKNILDKGIKEISKNIPTEDKKDE